MITTGANVADISKGIDLLDAVPPIAGRPGRPRRRFPALLADKGYDSRAFRQACRDRGTDPVIPHRGTHGIKGLGKLRYVVEQTFALLHQFRRLAVRWERRLDIHEAFVSLGCALTCVCAGYAARAVMMYGYVGSGGALRTGCVSIPPQTRIRHDQGNKATLNAWHLSACTSLIGQAGLTLSRFCQRQKPPQHHEAELNAQLERV